jgi:hypothetical protein
MPDLNSIHISILKIDVDGNEDVGHSRLASGAGGCASGPCAASASLCSADAVDHGLVAGIDSSRGCLLAPAVGLTPGHGNTIVANDDTLEVCMEAEATPVLQLLLLMQVSIVQSNIICINLQGSRLHLCGPRAQHLEGTRR